MGPKGEVRASDEQALTALCNRGVAVTLCTGRLYSGTREIAQQIGVLGPVACADGAQIVNPVTHEFLEIGSLESSDWILLGQLLQDCPVSLFAFAQDRILYDHADPILIDAVRPWSAEVHHRPTLRDAMCWSGLHEVVALLGVGTRNEIASAVRRCLLPRRAGFRISAFALRPNAHPPLWAFVMRRSGIDKSSAIRWLANFHGVDQKDVLVVGDWLNDIPMFRAAGLSYAMGHALPEVCATASHRLDATVWTGGGIAEAARRSGWL